MEQNGSGAFDNERSRAMNIKFGDKLVRLRKQRGMSQEELAAKLGVSRQAVSKWERGEASPDTYNLIQLARAYGMTLDELVGEDGERSGFRDTSGHGGEDAFDRGGGDSGADASGFVIHDDDGEVSRVVTITKDGVYVGDAEGETVVNVNSDGIYAKSGEKKLNRRWVHKDENSDDWDEDGFLDDDDDDDDDFFDDDETDGDGKEFNVEMNFSGSKKKDGRFWMHFPYPILCAVAYLAMGFVWDLWHPGWLIFLTIPLYYPLVEAAYKSKDLVRTLLSFPYPVLVAGVYLLIGFEWGLWHPYWMLFLTIPIYYAVLGALKDHSPIEINIIGGFPLLVLAAYLAMGFIWQLWHPGWLIFFTVPLYYPIAKAVTGRLNKPFLTAFPYSVFIVGVYLAMGFIWDLWNPYWFLLLTIPLYYPIASAISGEKHKKSFSYGYFITILYLILGFGWGLWHPYWLLFLTIPIGNYIINSIGRSREGG